MAKLLQICSLPDEWVVSDAPKGESIGERKKAAWKIAKRKEHERMKAFRKREEKRAKRTQSLQRNRAIVFNATIGERVEKENVFFEGKGQRTPKRARNTFSKEQAGTVGNVIYTKRFDNSHLICVYKGKRR